MRLGDYDALNAQIDKCVGIDGLGLEPVMAIRDIKALISVMPTIPAITVEWLEDKELDYRTTGDKMFSDAFAVVIGEWQKEQEAKNES